MNATIKAPRALIEALSPPELRGLERDAVQLLVTNRAARSHSHAHFFELRSFLRDGDLLVVNDSATLPAALRARRADGEWLMLHVATKVDERLWMTEPRGSVLCGEELGLADGGSAVMIAPVDPEQPRLWYAWFQLPQAMYAYLAQHGAPIRYGYVTEHFPLAHYQTMFAREPGSSEMPSAARPFTPRVVRALRRRGVRIAQITLHCSVASFESPERPAIERYAVSPETAGLVNRALHERRRVIAVGTTALRALESALHGGQIVASAGWTDLVIDENYRVKTADGLLTGFHDAGATHQWIVRAFLDRELVAGAYGEAAESAYSQHEFGDVHLIV